MLTRRVLLPEEVVGRRGVIESPELGARDLAGTLSFCPPASSSFSFLLGYQQALYRCMNKKTLPRVRVSTSTFQNQRRGNTVIDLLSSFLI